MRLNIKNFAGIESADIILNGITVIAGENNTGKSTVGKILFAVVNSVSDMQEKIIDKKIEGIRTICSSLLEENDRYKLIKSYENSRVLKKGIREQISRENELFWKNGSWNYDQTDELVSSILKNIHECVKSEKDFSVIAEGMAHSIKEIYKIPETDVALEIITRYFRHVFSNQINSLNVPEAAARINLSIKQKHLGLIFEDDSCSGYVSDMNLSNKAVYIEDPFVIDKVSDYSLLFSREFSSASEHFLLELLISRTNKYDDMMDGVIESVLSKRKLTEIYQRLGSVIAGNIVEKQSNEYYLELENLKKPVSVNNLSTGLKSFLILKMLIEKGKLNDRDMLILDEPEIHLHPEWQVVYAELIVLLQKAFDLSIVVTTHSPYFLDAINLFSVKYGTGEKVNYYLSDVEEGQIKINNVTDNIDLIYKKMASPVQMLDSLRYELNNN